MVIIDHYEDLLPECEGREENTGPLFEWLCALLEQWAHIMAGMCQEPRAKGSAGGLVTECLALRQEALLLFQTPVIKMSVPFSSRFVKRFFF